MNKLFGLIITFCALLSVFSCEKQIIEYVYINQLDTLYLPLIDRYENYETIIISKNNGDFKSLKEASLTLSEGKFILYFPDSLYEESVDCDLNIKEGWIIKGRGMLNTKIIFRDVKPDAHRFNINIMGSSEIRDISLISITSDTDDSRYCIHIDYPIDNLYFLCENVMMQGCSEHDEELSNNGNMLVLGIGTWNNYNLEFRNCIIKGDERIKTLKNGFGVINIHNNDCETQGRVLFENCKIISNGNAVLVRDYRFKYDNNDRLKDYISFKNTSISGFLVGYAEHAARNGFHFNVSNCDIDGYIGMNYLADPSFLSYTHTSLPLSNNILYLNNNSQYNFDAGTIVSLEYENKQYYWNTDDIAPLITGFNIAKEDSCNALLLVKGIPNSSAHILIDGVGKVGNWYEIDCNPGDYINVESDKLTTSSKNTNIIYLGERYIRLVH